MGIEGKVEAMTLPLKVEDGYDSLFRKSYETLTPKKVFIGFLLA